MPARVSNRHSSVDSNQGSSLLYPTDRSGSRTLLWLIFSLCTALVSSATDVVTYHNDIARTGQNLEETILTIRNVNSASFGKLSTFPVDGIIDAEPLYLSAVSIPRKGKHNFFYAVKIRKREPLWNALNRQWKSLRGHYEQCDSVR